jgi:hypothetical protein
LFYKANALHTSTYTYTGTDQNEKNLKYPIRGNQQIRNSIIENDNPAVNPHSPSRRSTQMGAEPSKGWFYQNDCGRKDGSTRMMLIEQSVLPDWHVVTYT